jgi:hypothetical protein
MKLRTVNNRRRMALLRNYLGKRAAGVWNILNDQKLETHPEINKSVLIKLRHSVGTVCDVACFAGKQPDGELRWILADIRLGSHQIEAWAEIEAN